MSFEFLVSLSKACETRYDSIDALKILHPGANLVAPDSEVLFESEFRQQCADYANSQHISLKSNYNHELTIDQVEFFNSNAVNSAQNFNINPSLFQALDKDLLNDVRIKCAISLKKFSFDLDFKEVGKDFQEFFTKPKPGVMTILKVINFVQGICLSSAAQEDLSHHSRHEAKSSELDDEKLAKARAEAKVLELSSEVEHLAKAKTDAEELNQSQKEELDQALLQITEKEKAKLALDEQLQAVLTEKQISDAKVQRLEDEVILNATDIARLKETAVVYEEEISRLKSSNQETLGQLETLKSNNIELNKRLKEARSEKELVKTDLNEAQKALEKVQNQYSALRRESSADLFSAQSELETNRRELEGKVQEVQVLQARIDGLTQEIQGYGQQLSGNEELIAELRAKLEQSANELTSLQQQNLFIQKQLVAKEEEYEANNFDLTQQLAQQKSFSSGLEIEIAQLKSQAQIDKERFTQLQSDLDKKQKVIGHSSVSKDTSSDDIRYMTLLEDWITEGLGSETMTKTDVMSLFHDQFINLFDKKYTSLNDATYLPELYQEVLVSAFSLTHDKIKFDELLAKVDTEIVSEENVFEIQKAALIKLGITEDITSYNIQDLVAPLNPSFFAKELKRQKEIYHCDLLISKMLDKAIGQEIKDLEHKREVYAINSPDYDKIDSRITSLQHYTSQYINGIVDEKARSYIGQLQAALCENIDDEKDIPNQIEYSKLFLKMQALAKFLGPKLHSSMHEDINKFNAELVCSGIAIDQIVARPNEIAKQASQHELLLTYKKLQSKINTLDGYIEGCQKELDRLQSQDGLDRDEDKIQRLTSSLEGLNENRTFSIRELEQFMVHNPIFRLYELSVAKGNLIKSSADLYDYDYEQVKAVKHADAIILSVINDRDLRDPQDLKDVTDKLITIVSTLKEYVYYYNHKTSELRDTKVTQESRQDIFVKSLKQFRATLTRGQYFGDVQTILDDSGRKVPDYTPDQQEKLKGLTEIFKINQGLYSKRYNGEVKGNFGEELNKAKRLKVFELVHKHIKTYLLFDDIFAPNLTSKQKDILDYTISDIMKLSKQDDYDRASLEDIFGSPIDFLDISIDEDGSPSLLAIKKKQEKDIEDFSSKVSSYDEYKRTIDDVSNDGEFFVSTSPPFGISNQRSRSNSLASSVDSQGSGSSGVGFEDTGNSSSDEERANKLEASVTPPPPPQRESGSSVDPDPKAVTKPIGRSSSKLLSEARPEARFEEVSVNGPGYTV
jgi:hypothetical protein